MDFKGGTTASLRNRFARNFDGQCIRKGKHLLCQARIQRGRGQRVQVRSQSILDREFHLQGQCQCFARLALSRQVGFVQCRAERKRSREEQIAARELLNDLIQRLLAQVSQECIVKVGAVVRGGHGYGAIRPAAGGFGIGNCQIRPKVTLDGNQRIGCQISGPAGFNRLNRNVNCPADSSRQHAILSGDEMNGRLVRGADHRPGRNANDRGGQIAEASHALGWFIGHGGLARGLSRLATFHNDRHLMRRQVARHVDRSHVLAGADLQCQILGLQLRIK